MCNGDEQYEYGFAFSVSTGIRPAHYRVHRGKSCGPSVAPYGRQKSAEDGSTRNTMGRSIMGHRELSAPDKVVFVRNYKCMRCGRIWSVQGTCGIESRYPGCDAVACPLLSQGMKAVPAHDAENEITSNTSLGRSPDVDEEQRRISHLRQIIVNKTKSCLDIGLALMCFCFWSLLVVSVVSISVLRSRRGRKRDRGLSPP